MGVSLPLALFLQKDFRDFREEGEIDIVFGRNRKFVAMNALGKYYLRSFNKGERSAFCSFSHCENSCGSKAVRHIRFFETERASE